MFEKKMYHILPTLHNCIYLLFSVSVTSLLFVHIVYTALTERMMGLHQTAMDREGSGCGLV